MNKGTNLKKRRKSGFLVRMRTASGKKIIKLRRSKKRYKISF
uniref:Ribosomal protein L34 n=1 Tax=Centroceras clavulatum TaxID=159503 RepID=A0A4D6WRW8_9FLOR|nr:ribosomal protein L34 [Centroceras clavulatum]